MVTPSLPWDDFDPRRFEEVCQMLVMDYTGDQATAIDGSGGDEAQDLRWRWNDPAHGLTIFEIKSFKKRLRSGQRRQVAVSFTNAVERHKPSRWVLVTRSNPTPSEDKWLQGLHVDIDVRRDWFGISWLEKQLAASPGLLEHLMGPEHQLLTRVAEFSSFLESKALTTGAAVAAHETKVRARRDSISPFWRVIVAESEDGTTTHTLVPKNSQSARLDPITIDSAFRFPSDDHAAAESAAALRQALNFGGSAEVPERFIERFQINTASEATRRLIGDSRPPGTLSISSIPDRTHLPATFTFKSTWEDGQNVEIAIVVSHRFHGEIGTTLHGQDGSGTISMELVVPYAAASTEGTINFTLGETRGRFAHEVLPGLAWMRACEEDQRIDMYAGPILMGASNSKPRGGGGDGELSGETRALYRYALCLVEIGKVAGRVFLMPNAVSDEDARPVVGAGHALMGGHTPMPEDGIALEVDEQGREHVLSMSRQGGQLMLGHSVDVTIGGEVITVPMTLYGRGLALQNRLALSMRETTTAILKCRQGTGLVYMREVTEAPPGWISAGTQGG